MASQAGAREGDWKCGGCGNRNYAFRSICNRCKQARLLVDSQTPADSKWLPRIGDWICAGCSNNNYASREKCNKCGQPKASGALSTQQGFAAPSPISPAGMAAVGLNMGMAMPLGMPSALGMPWPWGGSGGAGMTGGVSTGGSFRVGDWICTCGFHNYSSRLTCRQCHAPSEVSGLSAATLPPPQSYSFPGPGKRLATDDVGGDWANKRLNMGGDFSTMHHQYLQQQQQLAFAAGLNGRGSFYPGQQLVSGLNMGLSGAPLQVPASLQLPPTLQPPMPVLPPALLGKGAKQWRVGDWMCPGCSNHNFASRNSCNRCGKGKEEADQSTIDP
ncbi:unnamed protein product [Calypogeia fissa]